uniref:Polysaccharide biosynthesis protein CapD-like domain-containing protein n=1 Tax=viral metagenome TaxID=1070528 RepID=A0A6C0GZQ2_9ZZZZ
MLDKLIDNVKDLVNNKVILITGGTGTFGHEITNILLNNYSPKKIIIFSRDEFKQYNMKQIFPENKYLNIRYFVGDIRDYERLLTATKKVDLIFHAAAMKQVDTIEYNPFEAIKTNIYGTENVIKAAINNNVKKVIAVSTDKSVSPVNLYGATKLCLEKIIIHANFMSGENGTVFSVLRYGNVLNSRGSVVPLFLKQKENKLFTITDDKMTRFTLTINQAIVFVLNCASIMIGGEIFVPKLPSYNILQLAKCIDDKCDIKIIGKRPGEKLHEAMVSSTESHKTIIKDSFLIVLPEININKDYTNYYGTNYMEENKEYSSGNNELINNDRLIQLINEIKI